MTLQDRMDLGRAMEVAESQAQTSEKQCVTLKWLRYQRVINLKIQVRNTNQRNKWANTDPRIYRIDCCFTPF
jgi:hypothetical protein